MTTSIVTISKASYLGAASIVQATGGNRYMLNGVCINPVEGEGNDIVATDGHHIIKIHDPVDVGVGESRVFVADQPYTVAFTADQKRDLKKRANQDEPVVLNFSADTMTLKGTVSPIEIVDGKFPDYSRIVPDVTETQGGETPGFQLRLLVNFANVHKVLGDGEGSKGYHPIKIHAQGYTGALVEFPSHPNVIGVLMPFKC